MKVSTNPFAELRKECRRLLRDAIIKIHPEIGEFKIYLTIPPSRDFGELSSSIPFELARKLKVSPLEIAENIVEAIDPSPSELVKDVKAEGGGYINFYADLTNLSSLTIESARKLNANFGLVKTEHPERIIVEHTSVNPVHPIHIGQARNSVLGDSIARLLKARGHIVSRHYYIDDVGRQSAVIAYGYKMLGRPKPEGKPDHFIGAIYSITSCILEIERLKGEIEKAKVSQRIERLLNLQRSLDDWVSAAAELRGKYQTIFDKILDGIKRSENPEEEVSELIRRYEEGELEARLLIRKVCQICLEGFKQTLDRAGITFDSWDWESSLLWSGEVAELLKRLKRTPYIFEKDGVLEFDAELVAQSLNLKGKLGLREEYEIPSLTLLRADGTTLYTTRDIAYSLRKFKEADRVINVVGMEQRLAQLQLKLALYALGYVKEADNLIHFAYNLVRTPEYRMSGRRGRYVTFDDVMDEAIRRAYEEVSRRSPNLSEEMKHEISEIVGIGAVKYALLSTDPAKPVTFTWDRVLDFERNSAPYLQYSHARACNILKRASGKIEEPDYSLLKEPVEHDIILLIARFPETFIEASENLRPNLIAEFAYNLANKFNTFYASTPVIKAEPKGLRDARLALVEAVKITLNNSLSLLGINAPERM